MPEILYPTCRSCPRSMYGMKIPNGVIYSSSYHRFSLSDSCFLRPDLGHFGLLIANRCEGRSSIPEIIILQQGRCCTLTCLENEAERSFDHSMSFDTFRSCIRNLIGVGRYEVRLGKALLDQKGLVSSAHHVSALSIQELINDTAT